MAKGFQPKPFRFRTQRPKASINLPSIPVISAESDEELIGEVQGFPASAPEERLAKAFDKAEIQYIFRYTVGGPRGLPGWKEIDFLVLTKGVVYPIEVDTAFTHRGKQASDVLHDAIIQNDKDLQALGQIWPEVLHVDGDTTLANDENAKTYVKMAFNK